MLFAEVCPACLHIDVRNIQHEVHLNIPINMNSVGQGLQEIFRAGTVNRQCVNCRSLEDMRSRQEVTKYPSTVIVHNIGAKPIYITKCQQIEAVSKLIIYATL